MTSFDCNWLDLDKVSHKLASENLGRSKLKPRFKIPQNSENKLRGLYFSKALFEGFIFGGAYIRRGLSTEGNLRFKIDWTSLIV